MGKVDVGISSTLSTTLVVLASLWVVGAVPATSPCPPTCTLPDCRCASKEIPGGLRRDQVPQMVTISFDDAIRVQDYEMFYSKILQGKKNPNGCNVSVTFFVSHEDTDYSLAAELANSGHELAVHSITHRTPTTFWSEDRNNTEELTHEILDMRDILSRWAHVPKSNVVGYRTPFLASSENQLKILHENDFLYDCTMVTNEMYWPFTLDYKSPICSSPAVCPDESLPGLWVIPNINKVQNSSFSCSMIDSCAHPPKYTRDHWMHFFMHNFERHYNHSKAPFGLYAHASWFYFHDSAQRLQAFMDFLDYLGSLEDVYIVTMLQLIGWSRNPTPLDQLSTFNPWQCPSNTPVICSHAEPNICKYNVDDEEYIIRLCKDDSCPVEYPNITNPQGENLESTSVPVSSEVHFTSHSITPTSHMPASSEAIPMRGSESDHSSSMNIDNVFHDSTIDLTITDTALLISVTTTSTILNAPPTFVSTPPTSLSPSPTPVTTTPTSPCPPTCTLPDCQCASKEIPGGLRRDQVPQMVTISFDDAIRVQDYEMFYSKILQGRKNPNGCNVSVTFFASHKDTDYSLAAELANSGHELAVHSVTHRTPTTFWSEDRNNTDELTHEILDMRDILSRWAHVPKSNVVGYRTPFLASSENQLKILHENDFLYDCTMVTNEMYWPFTLDYKSPICSSPAVCPDESLPGLWIIPNINKVQNSSFSCSMIDSCAHPPKYTRDHWMHFFMHNFERHYNHSKAPFGLYAHASWFYFHDSAQRLQAFMDFLEHLGSLEDVYIVTMSQLIGWSRNPTPLDQLSTFEPWQCPNNPPTNCTYTDPNICTYFLNDTEYIIRLCKDDVCSQEYPNITNPQGVNTTLISTSVALTSEIISTSITSTSHLSSSNVMSSPGSEFYPSSSIMITSVTAPTTSVTTPSTSVTAPTTSVTAPTTSVTASTTSVSAPTTSVTAPTTSVTASTTSVTASTTSVTAQITSVTASTTSVTAQITSVTAPTTSVTTPTTSVTAQITSVTTPTTSVTAQITSVTTPTTSVTAPTTSVTAQITSMTASTTLVTAQITSMTAQITSVTTPTTSVTAPTTTVTAPTTSVTTPTTSVTAPTTSVTAPTTSVTAPTTSVTALTTTQSLTLSTSIQMPHVLTSSADPQSTTSSAPRSDDTRQQTHSVDPGVVAGVTTVGVLAISVAVTVAVILVYIKWKQVHSLTPTTVSTELALSLVNPAAHSD